MERLELDFKRAPRLGFATAALAAGAIAFASYSSIQYRQLQEEVSRKEARLSSHGVLRAPEPAAVQVQPVNSEQFAFARETIQRLATPWQLFFKAMEDARTDRVALLSIEPDVRSGIVKVTGEAKDYLAVLTYLAHLDYQDALTRVHLVRHEVRQAGPQRAVAFTISATWAEGR